MLGDTIILRSEQFNKKVERCTPKVKFSDYDGEDKYLFKNQKLFLLMKTGVDKDCYLSEK